MTDRHEGSGPRARPRLPPSSTSENDAEGRSAPQAPLPPATRPHGAAAFAVAFTIAFVLFLVTILPLAAPILLGGLLAAFATPLTGAARTPYGVAGQPLPPIGQRPIVSMNLVSDDYFRLLEIPLVAGRQFNADDRATTPRVCIVNATFAARVFGEQSALGQALIMGANNARVEIVGVVRDVKSAGGNAPTPEEVYFPMRQVPRAGLRAIAAAVRSRKWSPRR